MKSKQYWYNLLSRMRLHCTLCRFDGPNVGNPDMGNPPAGINAPSLIILPTPECNPISHKAAFTRKQKAAFRRHVRAVHPDWDDRIRWSL